jgi:hypothetical protein
MGYWLEVSRGTHYKDKMYRAIYIHCLTALKQRQAWIGLVVAASLWPIAVLFSPLAASLGNTRASTLAIEIAFLTVLAALAFYEPAIDRFSWLRLRSSQEKGLALGVVSRSIIGLVAGSLALLPATLIGGQISLLEYLSVGIATLHLSALYCLAERLDFPVTVRSVLITFSALAVPASVKGEGALSRILVGLFDPRAHKTAFEFNWLLIGVQIAFILALLLFSSLASRRNPS